MALITVPIFVREADAAADALDRARAAASGGAALVEWRIDALADEDDGAAPDPAVAAAVERLLAESPLPCILTCRSAREGGMFEGDPNDLGAWLSAVVPTGTDPPRYLDIEAAAWRESPSLRAAADRILAPAGVHAAAEGGLILSSHDFDGRPADLLQRTMAMVAEDRCTVIKLAWVARSLRDDLEAFDLLAERRKPMIALCMGPFGLPSRVLAGKFGALLTFAEDRPGGGTAPGQPALEDLRDLYRFASIGAATKVYGIVGWPVTHSRSPRLHNAGFAAVGHDGVYLPLPVAPEWEQFKATVGALVDHPHLDFAGASVTIPHKENLLRFVRERGGTIDPAAARIGAANTLDVGADGALVARNTDAPAVIGVLADAMGIDRTGFAGKRIAILGAGGVARAAASALADAGGSVVIFNRTAERAASLARAVGGVAGDAGALERERFDVYVNGTSVGMTGGGAEDESPLPAGAPLGEGVTVLDTVYAPEVTPLLTAATRAGARTVGGMEMLRRQAAMQFEGWTGRAMP